MSFRLIEAKRSQRSVSLLCRVLGVSRSGFYAWQSRSPSKRRRADDALTETINGIYKGSGKRYGAPKIHAELADDHEIFVGRKRVARLMRKEGLSFLVHAAVLWSSQSVEKGHRGVVSRRAPQHGQQ